MNYSACGHEKCKRVFVGVVSVENTSTMNIGLQNR
jgi:hypothetical protein